MKKIGILGANGQVGTEVCLLLRLMGEFEPVPICRSEVGSAFLRRCGFDPRLGCVDRDQDEARRLLSGLDIVADFSLPAGAASGVRKAMHAVITNLAKSAPGGVPMIYLSSITAFGVPDFHSPLREYMFSRNNYGASKRYAEGLARKAGRANGRKTYILRVGVVHGELQAVSRKTLREVLLAGDSAVHVPDCESFTVFAYSIAEAIAGIARGAEEPGRYTMLSNPGWSWRDVHEWYAKKAGTSPRIVPIGPDRPASLAARAVECVLGPLKKASKDVIAGYVGGPFPVLENALRGAYHRGGASTEIPAGLRQRQNRPYGNNHSVFPGRRPASISDSRKTMRPYAEQLQNILVGLQGRTESDRHSNTTHG
ncbi:MAG: NAD(P)-dependent oxidoreductase [Bryobacteraceae bacterium]